MGSVTPVMSVSWKASLPISLLPTCPVMQTMGEGVEHRGGDAGHHVRGAGSGGGDGDADLPVARANPSAMCVAPCSWRTSTWRIEDCVIAS
jgi:hypothetical protein